MFLCLRGTLWLDDQMRNPRESRKKREADSLNGPRGIAKSANSIKKGLEMNKGHTSKKEEGEEQVETSGKPSANKKGGQKTYPKIGSLLQ